MAILDVNAAGTVVAFDVTARPNDLRQDSAFAWAADGSLTALPGATPGGHSWIATGINAAGLIVGGGAAQGDVTDVVWRPTVDGYVVEVAPTSGDGYAVRERAPLEAINDHGLTVGGDLLSDPDTGAFAGTSGFRWTVGDPQLGTQMFGPGGDAWDGFVQVSDVNNPGAATGWVDDQPVYWAPDAILPEVLPVDPASDVPADALRPQAIDDAGLIVGFGFGTGGGLRPAAWTADRQPLSLVGPGGEVGADLTGSARDADAGLVVGRVSNPDSGGNRGAIWLDPLGGTPALYLDDLLGDAADGWEFLTADAVALGTVGGFDVLRIAGFGINPSVNDGRSTPVLLTRRTATSAPYVGRDDAGTLGTPIPEPAAGAFLLAGLVAVARRRC